MQKVIGPGNKWVNAAKQILSTKIAIDLPAGPSEILIIADDNSNYEFVIADFISQIEHDPDNIGIIVTPSLELINYLKTNLDSIIETYERKEIITAALKNSLIIKANNVEDCIRISNIIAPEHIELLINNPKNILRAINNAGAIFMGPYSPVPLGDYSAGTNHILPTGGEAKKYSGLNIFDFLKIISILECDKEGLKTLSESAVRIAEFEGLIAHKKSIEKRLK
jgi:histidinol dehydrogenase